MCCLTPVTSVPRQPPSRLLNTPMRCCMTSTVIRLPPPTSQYQRLSGLRTQLKVHLPTPPPHTSPPHTSPPHTSPPHISPPHTSPPHTMVASLMSSPVHVVRWPAQFACSLGASSGVCPRFKYDGTWNVREMIVACGGGGVGCVL